MLANSRPTSAIWCARSALLGILALSAFVAVQAEERERITPVKRGKNYCPSIAAITGHDTGTGRRLSRRRIRSGYAVAHGTRAVTLGEECRQGAASRRTGRAASRHRGRGRSRHRQLPERAERHQGTHPAESRFGTAQGPRRSRSETGQHLHAREFLGVQRVQAPTAWSGSLGVHGENIKVAIIDTGIDYTHANFGGPGTPEAYDAAFATSTAPADPALFGPLAPKVKGGIDLVGDDYDANDDASDPRTRSQSARLQWPRLARGRHWPPGSACSLTERTYAGPYNQSTHDSAFQGRPGRRAACRPIRHPSLRMGRQHQRRSRSPRMGRRQ